MKNKNLLLLIVIAIVVLSWLNVLDEYGDEYTTKSLTHAAATYGVARGINAIVSVIQSTEVSIGVASISPGELLDPMNDLVERFSWIVMMAMASLGLQKLLLAIASSLVFKVLVTLTGLLLIYFVQKKNKVMQNAVIRLFVVAFFLRFAVGGVVWANDLVEYFFLEEQRTQATMTLTQTRDSLTELSTDVQKDKQDQSWWDGMKDSLSGLTGDHEQRIKEQTEKASNSIIDLIVVYIAQTILFPIFFLWIFYRMMLWVWVYNWSAFIRSAPYNSASEQRETITESAET